MTIFIDQLRHSEVLTTCAFSINALWVLKTHSLSPEALHLVTQATTLSRVLYAASAWHGYALVQDRTRIERILSRLIRLNFCLLLLIMPSDYPLYPAF